MDNATAEELARAIMMWAQSGEEKGGNPYRLDFVKMADNILNAAGWKVKGDYKARQSA